MRVAKSSLKIAFLQPSKIACPREPIRRDNLTPEQRSYTMSRIKSRGTALEVVVMRALRQRGLRFSKHVSTLPGRPDVVFPRERLAVFINGDFWHGYRFPTWRRTLSPFWQIKIAANRDRDKRNISLLRRRSWTVIKIWQHDVRENPTRAIDRVTEVLSELRSHTEPINRRLRSAR